MNGEDDKGIVGKEPTEEQAEQARKKTLETSRQELDKRKMDWDYLAPRLKSLINARKHEIVKLKGRLVGSLPEGEHEEAEVAATVQSAGASVTVTKRFQRGPKAGGGMGVVRVIAESEKREVDKKGIPYDDGETVIAVSMTNNEIRLKALELAFNLRGDFPPEKKEFGGLKDGDPLRLVVSYDDEDGSFHEAEED